MKRVLSDEILDALPADNPEAAGARRDLRVLNHVMRHRSFFQRRIIELGLHQTCKRIIEIGAGDGTLLLELAERIPWKHPINATVIDRLDLISTTVRKRFEKAGWSIHVVNTDLFDWIESPDFKERSADLVFANLFLHHFNDGELKALFGAASQMTDCFMACEPRRSAFGKLSARLVACLGCNSVTRHDAIVSVEAGFRPSELTSLWDGKKPWRMREARAGLFSHFFSAVRTKPD